MHYNKEMIDIKKNPASKMCLVHPEQMDGSILLSLSLSFV